MAVLRKRRSVKGRIVLNNKFSHITYPDLLNQTCLYCSSRTLPLVVKIHPAIDGPEKAQQRRLLLRLNESACGWLLFESSSSINLLTTHARFTVTLNGGTLADNFYTGTPVLTLARSLFPLKLLTFHCATGTSSGKT